MSAGAPVIRLGWYGVLFAVTILGFILHEGAHWLMGEALGHDMMMSLNRAWAVGESNPTEMDAMLIALAGPVLSIGIAIIGYLMVVRYTSVLGYALLLSVFAMRTLAFGMSYFNPNDEAKVSLFLGLPWFVLPGLVCAVLLALVVLAVRQLGLGWKTHLMCYITLSIAFTVVIFADGWILNFIRAGE